MRIALSFVIAVLLCSSGWAQAAPGSNAVVGSWKGESKCTVPHSPCFDEHVVYRIAPDKKNPAQLNLDADKIVDGSPVFMGTLSCQFHASQSTLTCSGNSAKKDDWEFHVSGDTITGTLTIGEEKTLYRRITVRKK